MKSLAKNPFYIFFVLLVVFGSASGFCQKPTFVETDYAIFLFDHGEKAHIAAMLDYAKKQQKEVFEKLDFRIILFGSSKKAIDEEPFCSLKSRILFPEDLQIKEDIDQNWPRTQKLSEQSLQLLTRNLSIRKKALVGVSCAVFLQILETLQEKNIPVTALRDNPYAEGKSDYFTLAKQFEEKAKRLAVCSTKSFVQKNDQQIIAIGHAPTEKWVVDAQKIDSQEVKKRLGLLDVPIVVFLGSYGSSYENVFRRWVDLCQKQQKEKTLMQVLIVPHPKWQGVFEKEICEGLGPYIRVCGSFFSDPSRYLQTVEALAIADLVVSSDPTSTTVIQANALCKKVFCFGVEDFSSYGLLKPLINASQLQEAFNETKTSHQQNLFSKLSMPRNGAKLLWEEWLLE